MTRKSLRLIRAAIAAGYLVGVSALAQGQGGVRTSVTSPADPQPAATPQAHFVTVNLRNGESVRGSLIQVHADTVQLAVEGARRDIKLKEVASIIFFTAEKNKLTQPISQRGAAAAREALKALRKLAGATEVGVSRAQYGSLLIEAKAAVEEAVVELPDGDLKKELRLAVEAFTDGRAAWEQVGGPYQVFVYELEPGAGLMKKYKFKTVPFESVAGIEVATKAGWVGAPVVLGDDALSTIWGVARKHIDSAAALLSVE